MASSMRGLGERMAVSSGDENLFFNRLHMFMTILSRAVLYPLEQGEKLPWQCDTVILVHGESHVENEGEL